MAGQPRDYYTTTEQEDARPEFSANDTDHIVPERESYISLGTRQARQLQVKAKDIVQLVTSEPLITSGWQFPLRAGPEAIAVMAICLVASSRSDSKRIELNATNKDTGKLLLPFAGLGTNLQRCADLGRIAFGDAQACMGELQELAAFTIDRNGTIASIIGLLNDPEDARTGLRPELDALRASADELLQKAKDMENGFVKWRDFIMNLKLALNEQREHDLMAQEKKNLAEQSQAQKDQQISASVIQRLQKEMEETAAELKKADAAFDKSMVEYYQHASEPPPRQYTLAEVKSQMSSPENPTTYPGLFPAIKNILFGKSDKARVRDEALTKDRMDEDAKRVMQALQQMNNLYESGLKAQHEKLKAAEKLRDDCLERKQKVEEEYNQYVTKILDASQSMNVAKANLDRLKGEKLELDAVRNILEDSANQLGVLVSHIQNLKEFFVELTNLVKITTGKHLDMFLRTIESGIERGGQARGAHVIDNIKFGDIAKMKLLHNVLEIQARFSAIKDISFLYIDVSKRFIAPGINKMDALALLKPDEYQEGIAEFESWLEDSRKCITNMAHGQNLHMKGNVAASVESMTQQAIEWW